MTFSIEWILGLRVAGQSRLAFGRSDSSAWRLKKPRPAVAGGVEGGRGKHRERRIKCQASGALVGCGRHRATVLHAEPFELLRVGLPPIASLLRLGELRAAVADPNPVEPCPPPVARGTR